MLEIDIPGFKVLKLSHLVLDFNGTLACDGHLIEGVREKVRALHEHLEIHVLTADTFGRVGAEIDGLGCILSVIPKQREAEAKLQYIQKLGAEATACIGNGRNDRLMLESAALGIAVIQAEGASTDAILSADAATTSILDALDLLQKPLRLTATLRC
jgi:soluble P-type ATPase